MTKDKSFKKKSSLDFPTQGTLHVKYLKTYIIRLGLKSAEHYAEKKLTYSSISGIKPQPIFSSKAADSEAATIHAFHKILAREYSFKHQLSSLIH